MSTSGTFNFAPSLGEMVLNAFGRIGILPSGLTAVHMQRARMEANLLQASWSNQGVNLWTVDLVSVNLVQGTATYTVPAETVMILDVFMSTTVSGVTTDQVLTPMSRTDYASMPNKEDQAPPTTFWFDRLISPTITLWPVPDGNGPYVLNYYRYRLIQDAVLSNGTQVELPVLWLDAFAAGLAHRLSRHYAPTLEPIRKTDATEAWGIAATQNVENVPISITPAIGAYYR